MVGRMDEMMEMMKTMRVFLDVVEEDQRRGLTPWPNVKSDDDEEFQFANQNEQTLGEEEESYQVKMLWAISKIGKRPRVDVPNYIGNLNPEELIDWINDLEEYFEYEEIEDPKSVKFAKTKLKEYIAIWWKEVQLDRNRRGIEKITKWDRMVTKLKNQFIPVDYELELLKRLQNLRQKDKSMKEYTEEFHKMIIRIKHSEASKESGKIYQWTKFDKDDNIGRCISVHCESWGKVEQEVWAETER